MPDGSQELGVLGLENVHDAMRAMSGDPNLFIEHVLGSRLWDMQRAITLSVWRKKRTAVKSCHASGKSFVSAQVVLAYLMLRPGARVVTTAPTFRQVVKLLWVEIRKAYKRASIPLGGRLLTNQLIIDDGWEAMGYTSDDPDAFQGVHSETGCVLVVLDEASGIELPIWEAIEGILTGDDSRLLSIGNPTDPTGAFAREFKSPGTERFTISAFDTPNLQAGRIIIPGLIDPSWVEDKKTRWGVNSPAYQARVLGQFPDISERNVFQLRWLERAQSRLDLKPGLFDRPRLGVDVAREGSDVTVFYVAHGPLLYKLFELRGASTMTTVGWCIKFHQKYNFSSIRVDDIGVGGGVKDRLKELDLPVRGVNVGVSGKFLRDPIRYLNRRAELHFELRDALEHGHVQLNDGETEPDSDRPSNKDDDLLHQASSVEFELRSEGKIKIEAKKELKARIGISPDHLDAALLAWSTNVLREGGWVPDGGEMVNDQRWVGALS